jgi:flagellar motor switch protein FliN/FliY
MSTTLETAASIRSAQLRELAMLHDVPLQISIEIGRLKIKVGELIKLIPGSLLELKKPAGEPLDICINGNLVARGEVNFVEQTSGVRIIEILKPGSIMSGTVEP